MLLKNKEILNSFKKAYISFIQKILNLKMKIKDLQKISVK